MNIKTVLKNCKDLLLCIKYSISFQSIFGYDLCFQIEETVMILL